MDSDAEKLVRAKGYPYSAPDYSYIFYRGRALKLGRMDLPPDMARRKPVLAYGSNAAPDQLRRKFPKLGDDEAIPVLRTVLPGFDVVYSARFARYGAITAMLAPSPGTTLQTFTTFLTPEQLDLMHVSERRGPMDHTGYEYGRLRSLTAMVEAVGIRKDLFAYQSQAPALVLDGALVAFAEVTAKNRTLPAKPHGEVLATVAGLLSPGEGIDAFLLALIADPERRRSRSAALADLGRAVDLPGFTKDKIKPPRSQRRAPKR